MNRRYEQEIDYANVNELLRYVDEDTPLEKEEIQQIYRRLFNKHMSKRLSNRVMEIIERGA